MSTKRKSAAGGRTSRSPCSAGPSRHPQGIRGNKGEVWYYEYPRHLEFYHHCADGVVASFHIPWHRIEKSLRRCKPKTKLSF